MPARHCISDNHNSRPLEPNGVILIHTGDHTTSGIKHELEFILSWLESQPHPHKFLWEVITIPVLLWLLKYMSISNRHIQALLVSISLPHRWRYVATRYPSTVVLILLKAIPGYSNSKVHSPGYTLQHTNPLKFGLKSLSRWRLGPPLAHLDSNINLGKSTDGCYALLTAYGM